MTLLRRLAVLLAVEGVALGAVGVVGLVVADSTPGRTAAAAAVATGLLLLWLARATDRGRRWSRSPGVVLNLVPLPVALGAFRAGAWEVGVPLALLPAAALYLWATPELRLAFRS